MSTNIKISEMTTWNYLSGSELFVISYSGQNYSVSSKTIADFCNKRMAPKAVPCDGGMAPKAVPCDGGMAPKAVFDGYLATMGIHCDPNTGLYSLNGLTDITYDQMLRIASLGRLSYSDGDQRYSYPFSRTHLPALPMYNACFQANLFYENRTIETVNLHTIVPAKEMFRNCRALRAITLLAPNNNREAFPKMYVGCTALVEIRVSHVYSFDIDLSYSPLLSMASVQNIMDKYNGDKGITVTLHPDAYSRLTPEMKDFASTKKISLAQKAQIRQ